jgi:hypothetical protein
MKKSVQFGSRPVSLLLKQRMSCWSWFFYVGCGPLVRFGSHVLQIGFLLDCVGCGCSFPQLVLLILLAAMHRPIHLKRQVLAFAQEIINFLG